MERRTSTASAYYSMSSSMASSPSRSSRVMTYEETRSQGGPRSTGGSFSSLKEEMLGSDSDRDRGRGPERLSHLANESEGLVSSAASALSHDSPFVNGSEAHASGRGTRPSQSCGGRGPRRPSAASYHSDQAGDSSRDQAWTRMQRDDAPMRSLAGKDRAAADPARLVPPEPAMSSRSASGMPRSVSGPTIVGRSKVQKMVGDFEAVALSDSADSTHSTSLRAPPGRSNITASSSAMLSASGAPSFAAGLPRSRSASNGAPNKGSSSRASAAVHSNGPSGSSSSPGAASKAALEPRSAASSASFLSSPSSSSSPAAATSAIPAQSKPSLRARLFGFKTSSKATGVPAPPATSPSLSGAAAPSFFGGSSRETVGAAAVVSPFLRQGGLLSPTPSSYEFHGSDWSDSASIAHSVRSEYHATSPSGDGIPRRSASVRSGTARPSTGSAVLDEHQSYPLGAGSGGGSGASSSSNRSAVDTVPAQRVGGTARAKAASLRQKVSNGSLRNAARSSSPSSSVSTTASSSARHQSSDYGVDSSYKQAVGRRGTNYSREPKPADGGTSFEPLLATAREDDDVRPGTARQEMYAKRRAPAEIVTDATPLQSSRRPSATSSEKSSETPNFPSDQSFLLLSKSATKSGASAWSGAIGPKGELEEGAMPTSLAPPPPSRMPPPPPPLASAGSATAVPSPPLTLRGDEPELAASGSAATLQPAVQLDSPKTPVASTSRTVDGTLEPSSAESKVGGSAECSATPTAPTASSAPATQLASLSSGEALAAATDMIVRPGSRGGAGSMGKQVLSSGESMTSRRRRRVESRDGGNTLSRQPSNASSDGSSAQGSWVAPSPYSPRSSSLHGHDGSRSTARRAANRSSVYGTSSHTLSSPLNSGSSTVGRGSGDAPPPQILPRTTSSSAIVGVSGNEALRPGLPPKNPLRNHQTSSARTRPQSARSVSDPIYADEAPPLPRSRHPFAFASPGLAAETSESLMSAWQLRQLQPPSPGDALHSELAVSPWIGSPSTPHADRERERSQDDSALVSGGAGHRRSVLHPLAEMPYADARRQSANLGIGLGEDAGIPKSLSAGALTALSPQNAPWLSEETLSSGVSGRERGVTLVDQPVGGGSERPEHGSLAHSASKRSKLTLSSAFRSGRSRSKTFDASSEPPNDADRRKKEGGGGTGSKIWSFAKELGGGDNANDLDHLSSSTPSTLRKSRVGTKKGPRGETIRPQIRRVFDDDGVNRPPIDAVSMASSHGHASGHPDSRLESTTATPALDGPAVGFADALAAANEGASPSFPGSPGPSAGLSVGSRAGTPWLINRDNLDDDEKRIVKRWYVLRELLETERSYASDLAIARDVYLARAKVLAGVVSNPASPFSMSSSGFFQPLTSSPGSSRPQTQHQSQLSGSNSTVHPPLPSNLQRVPQSLGQPPLIMHPTSPQSPAKHLLRQASADSNPHALGMSHSSASPASLASSNPSNRSSTYTVSSLSSQTSDGTSHPLPPLPAGVGASGGAARSNGAPLSPSITTAAMARHPSSATSKLSTSNSVAPSMSRLANQSSVSLGSAQFSSASSTPTGLMPGSSLHLSGTASSGAGTPDAPLSAADVRIIFAQLEQCAALADEMVAALEVAVGGRCTAPAEEANALLAEHRVSQKDEDDRVGEAFLRLMPRIDQVYAAYCSRHEASMSRLQELSTSEPKAAAFLRDCTAIARKHTNAWDLSSLLIKPVQRVLKYPLLIQEVLASTTADHSDHAGLRKALAEIQKVADHINEVKKRKDLVDQIVAGKTARRSASQKVQHGTIKKIKRQQERIRTAVAGPPPDVVAEDEEAYRALVDQLLRLEGGLEALPRQCLSWSDSLRISYVAQVSLLERWRRVYLLDDEAADVSAGGVDERLTTMMRVLQELIVDEAWQQLDAEIRASVVPMAERIAKMFANPKSVIAKRNDRVLDYTRYRNEALKSNGGKTSDRKLAEGAAAFLALHSQLMDELPMFNYGIQSLVDVCVESLARLQAAHHLRVQKTLVDFWRDYAWSDRDEEIRVDPQTGEASMRHLNPVKLFWEVHSGIAAYADNMQIVTRQLDQQLPAPGSSSASVTSFSPLQLRTDLPKPEFTPPAPLHAPSGAPASFSMAPLLEQPRRGAGDGLSSRQSFRTASGSKEPTPYNSPAVGSTSPRLAGDEESSLLGSPVSISPALGGATAPYGNGGGGGGSGSASTGLGMTWARSGSMGRSSYAPSSNSSVVSPRVGGLRSLPDGGSGAGTGDEEGGNASVPPTPISKDSPLRTFFRRESSTESGPPAAVHRAVASGEVDKRDSLPVLPALSFNENESLFLPAQAVSSDATTFLERIPERRSSIADESQDEQRSSSTPGALHSSAPGAAAAAVPASLTNAMRGRHQVLATMAAVADSPARSPEAQAAGHWGYPLLSWATGDLFRVLYIDDEDRRYYLGKTERGELGWAERDAFMPLV